MPDSEELIAMGIIVSGVLVHVLGMRETTENSPKGNLVLPLAPFSASQKASLEHLLNGV